MFETWMCDKPGCLNPAAWVWLLQPIARCQPCAKGAPKAWGPKRRA